METVDINYALEDGNGAFEIKDDLTAEAMLREVLENNAERDRLMKLAGDTAQMYMERRDNIAREYERKNEWNMMALRNYFDRVEKQATKTQQTYRLLSGRMVLKRRQPEYRRDEDKMLDWAYANAPEFVKEKVTTSVAWDELKKLISTVDGQAVYEKTGEFLPFVELVERPDVFVIEGGK